MFLAAWGMRELEEDDKRWYEMTIPGTGRATDIRPFNPFAVYFMVGEMLKRSRKGTLFAMDPGDIIRGIAGVNIRAGLGLFAMDRLIQGLGDLARDGKILQALKQAGGELLSGLLVPFRTLTDLYAQYDPDFQIVRESRSRPLLGPALGQFGQGEPLYSPTGREPVRREAPALRQITGLTLRPEKNAAERELDRFQFSRQEILPSTGNPEADNLIAKHLGPLVENRLAPAVKGLKYRSRTDAEKMNLLRDALGDLREVAVKQAKKEKPDLFRQIRIERLPSRQRFLLEERRESAGVR